MGSGSGRQWIERPSPVPERETAWRILVVDDDQGVRGLVTRALAIEGIEVDHAEDGEEGLRLALSGSFHVILLDLQLPKLDGISVLGHLLRAIPDQAVIGFSCLSDPGTRRECLQIGAKGFLAKPFSLRDLVASVSRLLPYSETQADEL
jgi:DNA-binding response OmpR family regulator